MALSHALFVIGDFARISLVLKPSNSGYRPLVHVCSNLVYVEKDSVHVFSEPVHHLPEPVHVLVELVHVLADLVYDLADSVHVFPAVRSLPLNIDKLVLSVVCDYGFRIK